MKKETGGTAFPMAKNMTLRDYFAAKAMPLVVNHIRGVGAYEMNEICERVSLECYRMADAMLKEREK